ncbi:MAG TPA: phenylalanine--tRNA ligase beta subunit-related protein [Solirubrobacterales bacterium]
MEGAAARSEMGWEPAPEQGWVAPHIAAEFPGLGIAWVEVDARPGPSSEAVRRRLRDLSDRFYGAHAIHMREQPIPWSYRVFFRQIGLDPDRVRTPVEQLALDRLHDGAFLARGLPADALTIATAETCVALRAYDAERLEGRLCIRESAPGESLSGRSGQLEHGTLTIADERGPVELLFGEAERRVERDTRRIAIAAVQVKGVPQVAVDEALWIAVSVIQS